MSGLPLFHPGQRCVSTAEPELGLGKIISANNRFVEVAFPGSDCARKYAVASAPLKRIIFSIGDSIKDLQGNIVQITGIDNANPNGAITYRHENGSLAEDMIAESCSASTPLQRLLSGTGDRCEDFFLRMNLLALQSEILQSPVRGFMGGRIELLPHQLFIAGEVASRRIVRVLLADETGLGKTIEACLILHRLILTGRVRRCLVCTPEPLVHQWFIELLRRFNLRFTLFTEEYFASCVSGANPFLSEQFGICAIPIVSHDQSLCDMAAGAGWDMVIVDEAHHIHHETKEYECIKKLSGKSAGLILLTATPEQLGHYDHFLRLQLLDPARYTDFKAYEAQTLQFGEISQIVNNSTIKNLPDTGSVRFDELFVDVPPSLMPMTPLSPSTAETMNMRRMSVMQIIDRFGTGRVMFRNTRRVISGFPKRIVHIVALPGNVADAAPHDERRDGALSERPVVLKGDPRSDWLIGLLKADPQEKFLLICTTKEMSIALREALLCGIKINIGLFHEDMTLLQRDRNAAWFAEDNGARVLICSEIGSEGRNFQFCRNLVLFDLPVDPEILEQRIGRIDRIGQGSVIHIHVPYVSGTPQEILCRWYHEGLDAFNKNEPAAGRVGEMTRATLMELLAAKTTTPERVDSFIKQSTALSGELSRELSSGRDCLLELSSFRPKSAERLQEMIVQTDHKNLAAKVIGPLFKHYGVCVEEAGVDKWILQADYVADPRFPLPRQQNPQITYSRKTALAREDIEYVSIDHPMTLGGLDLFLSSDCGTGVFAVWNDKNARELLLEALYVLECVAPDSLCVNRFLPPTLVRVVVNHTAADVTPEHPPEPFNAALAGGVMDMLLAKKKITDEALPRMLAASDIFARKKALPLIDRSLSAMRELLVEELLRLRDLQKINSAVSDAEIEECEREKEALEKYLKEARVRLDSVRVVWRGNV